MESISEGSWGLNSSNPIVLYCLSSTWLLILNDLSVADQASVSLFLAQDFLSP